MENLTAKISCFARAYHYKTNERPIFGDSAAAALLGGDYDVIAAHIAQGIQFFAPGFRGAPTKRLKSPWTGSCRRPCSATAHLRSSV